MLILQDLKTVGHITLLRNLSSLCLEIFSTMHYGPVIEIVLENCIKAFFKQTNDKV